MKFKMLICIGLSAMLFTSCSEDNKDDDSLPFSGRYKFTSMTSDVAADLDNNGVTSTDLMTEIPEYFTNYRTDLVVLDGFIKMASFSLPHCNVYFESPGIPQGYTIFTASGMSAQFKYNPRTKGIDLVMPENLNLSDYEEFGMPLKLEYINDSSLKATFYKRYYDYSTAGWKWLTVTAAYYKTANNL
ncbi:hypothetical protein ACLI08_12265 [Flavobacterium sp. RNTU_13]|uniref:hypothetical protein n=1 Tax=Flavobacterium sp. RNTU_13 TaxID=3375145 RepID=UPI003986BEC3